MTQPNPFEYNKFNQTPETLREGDRVVYGLDPNTFGAPEGNPEIKLTVGKVYEIISVSDDGKEITIKDDEGVNAKVNIYHFRLKK